MAFASTKEMLVLGVLMAVALHCAAAANYTVGGISGWIVPTSNAQLYDEWTGTETFKVGDTLVFNFNTNVHNVLRVTQANYKSCSSASPMETYNTGPATVKLNDTGAHYYICGITGHCSSGQKVTITVAAASSTTPTSPTTPTSTTNTSDASYHSIPFMGIFFGVSAAFFSL